MGRFLRNLRQELADRARFIPGTVTEIIDATHVYADIGGKEVPAYTSPIFMPAVKVGAPVVLLVQGSQYRVSDAPESEAVLITKTDLAALKALLPASNIIPNPLPVFDAATWNSGGATWAAAGWSYDAAPPDDPGYVGFEFWAPHGAPLGPDGLSQWAMVLTVDPYVVDWAAHGWSFRTFPVDADLAVTNGRSYSLSAHVALQSVQAQPIGASARLGVVWAGGTEYGTTVALDAVDETWTAFDPNAPATTWTAIPAPPGDYGAEATKHLTGTFTADGVTGRPFVEFLLPQGWDGDGSSAGAGDFYSSCWSMS